MLATHLRLIRFFSISLCLCLVAGASVLSPEAHAEETKTADTKREYYVEDIKATMNKHIAAKADKDGVFHMLDDKTGETLALRFITIHDPVRQIGQDVYFACTDFHVVGEPDKVYDLDFWMNDKTGELKVFRSKVHKEPRKSLIFG